MRKRWKKISGRTTPRSTLRDISKDKIIEECLDPQKFNDEWEDWRDGMRSFFRDWSKIKSRWIETRCVDNSFLSKIKKNNQKLKKLLNIRTVRKNDNKKDN